MAEFTKDGITISPGSGSGSAELKIKVATPPYQGFDNKTVEFTVQNTDHSVSKTLSASINGIVVWEWGEDYGNEQIQIGSSVEDLSFSVTGRGNVLKTKQTNLSPARIGIQKSGSNDILVKSLKFFIPSIDNENPIMTLSNWNGSLTYLDTFENWPDAEWASQNGDIYEWRMDIELDPFLDPGSRSILLNFAPGEPVIPLNTRFLYIVQEPTEIISLNPKSLTLAPDGTESSVQLSTLGAWTVE